MDRARLTKENLTRLTSEEAPAACSTAMTMPYCSAVLKGSSGWFAAKPAGISTLEGGRLLL